MLAESIEYNESENNSDSGVLQVTGYLRGHSLSANSLVHIPGSGDFQLLKVRQLRTTLNSLYSKQRPYKTISFGINNYNLSLFDNAHVILHIYLFII